MERQKKDGSKIETVRINRWQTGLSVTVQLVLWFSLVGMANYLSFRHYQRLDFSRDKKYSLSPQSRNFLKNLRKPVKAVIFFSGATEIAPDVNALLREYEYGSDHQFTYEVVDPFRNFTRAQELQAKYKFGANENILILDSDNRSKFVNASDMADFEQPDQLAMMSGQTQPKLKAFKGEQAITSALIELTEGKPNQIYYVTGHGEPDLSGQELKIFSESLSRQNIQIAALNLLNASAIPADARALILCGPKYDFSELEMKLLSDFREGKGRFFVLLNAYVKTPRLAAWLSARGITPQEDQIIKLGTFLEVDANGKPQLKSDVIRQATFVVADSKTAITKELAGVTKQLLGVSQSLSLAETRIATDKTKIVPILESAEGFWGEVETENTDRPAFFDPKKDHVGPLHLAACVETGGVLDSRVRVDTSRLVVVGNAEFLSNNGYRKSEGVTLDVAINALNWLLDREQVMGIAPKLKQNVPLNLDEKQMGNLAATVMLIVPGLVALIGVLVWWRRRA